MSRLSSLALMPILGLAGCFGMQTERESLPLVHSAPSAVSPTMQPERRISSAPAMKASSERVLQVGQRLILANPQIGLRPLFVTVGVTHPEIFHKGGSLGGCQVVVSEGIVSQCPSDAELAAILAKELEKIVAERESLASPSARLAGDRPPLSESIGSDSGGTFGSSDGTRMMELAHYEKRSRERAAKPATIQPDTLARKYLAKAGYEPASLDQVKPLLRRADQHFEMEKTVGAALLPPAPPTR